MALLILFLLSWSILTTPSSAAALKTVQQLLLEADQTTTPLPYYPIPPSLDPWYRPPLTFDWTSIDPGTVLKIRPAPLLNLTVANALLAYQLLYRSTDSRTSHLNCLILLWTCRVSGVQTLPK